MPTIELSKKELERYIGRKVDERLLKEKISYLGTDLEGIERDIINVEVFPNRPDLLSQPGFSRAIGYFIGVTKKVKNYTTKKSNYVVKVDRSVSKVRPFTACAVVKNLKFDDQKIKEIVQIQEKLHITFGRNRKKCAIGVYPLEKIQFPIRYLGRDPDAIKFVPLEEKSVMSGSEVLYKTKAGKEFAHLLEGESVYPIFEDSNKEILSMPPIINSHTVGKISEETKDVFIECSGFDYETLSECLNMIVTSLADMSGDIHEVKIQYPSYVKKSPNLKPKKMKIDYDLINKRLGVELSRSDVKKALLKMGIAESGGYALIPPYRTGFFSYADLAEEIAIGYGYERFEGTIPEVATVGQESPLDVFKRRVSEALVGLGFVQVSTLHLLSRERVQGEAVELADAKSSEFNTCRNEMITSILNVLQSNRGYEYPQKIFETGKVFVKEGKNICEPEKLCCAIADAETDYTRIRQVMDYIGKRAGVDLGFVETEDLFFIKGRVAKIMLGNKEIGRVGEVSPALLRDYELEVPAAVLEVDVSELV